MLPSVISPAHRCNGLIPNDLIFHLKTVFLDGILKLPVRSRCIADIHGGALINGDPIAREYVRKECEEGGILHFVVENLV